MLEIEEISSRTIEDVDTSLLYKQREIEGMNNIIRNSNKDKEELENQLRSIKESILQKNKQLLIKEEQEKELQNKFKKLFEERESLQHDIQESNIELTELQNMARGLEEQINYLRVGKARFDAEHDTLKTELEEYSGLELIQSGLSALEEKLKKTQEALQQIGSINMRALEVYEEVKKEYDIVAEKVTTLEKEKLDILEIISEIDHKKKHSFMKTFRAMNELFTQNFAKLYTKGFLLNWRIRKYF